VMADLGRRSWSSLSSTRSSGSRGAINGGSLRLSRSEPDTIGSAGQVSGSLGLGESFDDGLGAEIVGVGGSGGSIWTNGGSLAEIEGSQKLTDLSRALNSTFNTRNNGKPKINPPLHGLTINRHKLDKHLNKPRGGIINLPDRFIPNDSTITGGTILGLKCKKSVPFFIIKFQRRNSK
jgi:hypothetical protein